MITFRLPLPNTILAQNCSFLQGIFANYRYFFQHSDMAIMGYFLPITLKFVLPMAALFATALVYD